MRVIPAFDADGVTVQQFNEEAGGQVVFHLHVHVIPRFAGIALRPHTGVMEKPEVLHANAEKIRAALNAAPEPPCRPTFFAAHCHIGERLLVMGEAGGKKGTDMSHHRIDPLAVAPEALKPLRQLEAQIAGSGLEESLIHLVKMRA